MTTKVSIPFRREIMIGGAPYTVTIAQEGVKLTRKRYRIGALVTWAQILTQPKGHS